MWNKIKNASLAVKIIGLSLSVLVFMGAISFYSINNLAYEYKHQVNDQFETYAVDLGEKITAQLYERYGDVQAFAKNDVMYSMNWSKIQARLDEYVPLYGIYDLIVVLDTRGNLISVNSKDVAGVPVNSKELEKFKFSEESWFKAALEGRFTEDKKNNYSGTFIEDFIDDPLMKTAFGENRFTTSFTAPIKDAKGQVIGVVSNRAGKRWFEAELVQTYEKLHKMGFSNLELTVVNNSGKMISFVDDEAGKMHITTDPKEILQEDFLKGHVGVNAIFANQKTGSVESKYATDPDTDLVGYHQIDNSKSIASMGWVTFVHDNLQDAYHEANSAVFNFYIVMALGVGFCFAFAFWAGRTISNNLAVSSRTLDDNSKEVLQAAEKIAVSAQQLSVASREQAAALQETVTAVDEITATIQKNSEATERSRDVSNDSIAACEKGKRTVQDMMTAITDIETMNTAVSDQMADSNQQLVEMTKLIHDISNKTKVINEIVFQTKLLSFNASVEAARAGEYGKGFAVVAEEVGNLAKMSGEASKDISALLDQSVQKVNHIVSDSKTKVDQMTFTSKTKIKAGIDTANRCNEELETILQNVQEVDSMITEISTATREQSTGIREISSAFAQMEQVTQQNATAAQASASAGEQLKAQSDGLQSIVGDLNMIVFGSDGAVQSAAPSKPAFKKFTNIVPFTKKSSPVPTAAHPSVEKAPQIKAAKKVSGGGFTPSSDDPGFDE
jgi:methyl-accepting chemotaxis protein